MEWGGVGKSEKWNGMTSGAQKNGINHKIV
jgi:hypothetical protein